MKKLTKKVKKEIQERIEKNQPEIYWDYNSFDRGVIKDILEKGLDDYVDELWEMNLDYICDLEYELIKEIQSDYDEYDPDEIEDFSKEFICVDMNIKGMLNQLPEIPCLLKVYSNYDCCNSFDSFEPESYIYEVYKRVKAGVKKSDYLCEFHNGAYGGSLFCFGFNTDIKRYFEIKEEMKNGKTVTIPKGTQYGFHSSFQGASSMFEKETYKNMTIPIEETKDGYYKEYDRVELIADSLQGYSTVDVFGQNVFNDGDLTIK